MFISSIKKVCTMFLVLLFFLALSCGNDENKKNTNTDVGNNDTSPPQILSVTPENGATGVTLNTTVTVTFNREMNASSLNKTTFIINGVTGIVKYSNNKATFAPYASLEYNTQYTAAITTGAKDINGNAMISNYEWSFTTVNLSWEKIAAGAAFNLAIKSNNALYAWGDNRWGQLGDGTTTDKNTPIQIGDDKDWDKIAGGGKHAIAIKADGTLYAWGNNSSGQIGDGTTTDRATPNKIGNDTNWAQIDAGYFFSVALKSDGTLYAWGDNTYGQLGDSTITNSLTPIKIGNDTDWEQISCGGEYVIALKNNGTLYAWGRNYYGQLGDGTTTDSFILKQIGTDNDWIFINAGFYHSFAIKSNGRLYGWGFNETGSIGDNSLVSRSSPVLIGTDTDWKYVFEGYVHSVGIKKNNGALYGWGYNNNNQLLTIGNGEIVYTPELISSNFNWANIAVGEYHNLILDINNKLYSWGNNKYGQKGNGTNVTNNEISLVNE